MCKTDGHTAIACVLEEGLFYDIKLNYLMPTHEIVSFNISEPSIKITLKEKLHLHFLKEISVLARQQQESVVQVLVFFFFL